MKNPIPEQRYRRWRSFSVSSFLPECFAQDIKLTLHRDVVQQKGESDSEYNRVLQPLQDSTLVELFDDDCGSDLFPLDPVVGEYCNERMKRQ